MNSLRYIVAAFLLAALASAPSRAQGKADSQVPPPPDFATKYERSEKGLLTQLQLILATARNPERTKAFINALQLPKSDDYFHAVYRPDVELFWAGSYNRALMHAPASFESLFVRLSLQQGEFNIRTVTDAPASKFEQALMGKMNGPVDVYAVSWKPRKATGSSGEELLGYYAYLGGRFRWFYMLGFPKTAAEAAERSAEPSAKPAAGSSNGAPGGSAGSASGKSNSSAPSQPPSQQ